MIYQLLCQVSQESVCTIDRQFLFRKRFPQLTTKSTKTKTQNQSVHISSYLISSPYPEKQLLPDCKQRSTLQKCQLAKLSSMLMEGKRNFSADWKVSLILQWSVLLSLWRNFDNPSFSVMENLQALQRTRNQSRSLILPDDKTTC